MTSDARSLSPLEQRAKRAIALRMREQGYTYRAIGEAVGVHLRTVAHWVKVRSIRASRPPIEGGRRGALPGERRRPEQEALIRTQAS